MDGLGVSTGRRRGLRRGWGGCGVWEANRLLAHVLLAWVAIEIIAIRFVCGEQRRSIHPEISGSNPGWGANWVLPQRRFLVAYLHPFSPKSDLARKLPPIVFKGSLLPGSATLRTKHQRLRMEDVICNKVAYYVDLVVIAPVLLDRGQRR